MMEPFVRNFLRAALVWLGVAGLLGLAMIWVPRAILYRPAHVHAALLGFVSMFIFGVAYHVLPRFSGRPLPVRRLPTVHLWLANGGLALLVAGWLLRPTWARPGALALQAGGILTAAGMGLFIYTVWKLLAVPVVPEAARRAVGGQSPATTPGTDHEGPLIPIRRTTPTSEDP